MIENEKLIKKSKFSLLSYYNKNKHEHKHRTCNRYLKHKKNIPNMIDYKFKWLKWTIEMIEIETELNWADKYSITDLYIYMVNENERNVLYFVYIVYIYV